MMNKENEKIILKYVEMLKREFFFIRASMYKDAIYQFTDSQIDEFTKEFLKNE